MNEYAETHGEKLSVFSMHDKESEITGPYIPQTAFKGFSGNKPRFVLQSFYRGIKSRVVVLSHINLLLPGYLVKLFSPSTRLVLIAHGIEVWKPLSRLKRKMLEKTDLILPVSVFSKEKMKQLFHLPEQKFTVLNNALDPYLPAPVDRSERNAWRKKYGIPENALVLMTLSRLSAKEINKGYDRVLSAIKKLLPDFASITYLFVGKYDEAEKERLENVCKELCMEDVLLFTGFVPDEAVSFYYNMADIYIMPSEKEGFGISFIEAMYYHLPVIAGNRDGTTDALLNGRLGTLVDPRDEEALIAAVKKIASGYGQYIPDRRLLMEHFSYPVYKEKWFSVLRKPVMPAVAG